MKSTIHESGGDADKHAGGLSRRLKAGMVKGVLLLAGAGAVASAFAMAGGAGADADLRISRYSRVVTAEGVTREARYEETMLRRAGHVWTTRVLPAGAHGHGHGHEHEHEEDHGLRQGQQRGQERGHGRSQAAGPHKVAARKSVGHKHFNPVTLARHVAMEGGKLRLSYVDAHSKEVIAIPPGEFDNVGFDGSWDHAWHLLDSKGLQAMPVSQRRSPVPGARWRERERDGLYERVLWDDGRKLPLVIESGDAAGTFYNRTELKVAAGVTRELPWQNLEGYAQREYADYLD